MCSPTSALLAVPPQLLDRIEGSLTRGQTEEKIEGIRLLKGRSHWWWGGCNGGRSAPRAGSIGAPYRVQAPLSTHLAVSVEGGSLSNMPGDPRARDSRHQGSEPAGRQARRAARRAASPRRAISRTLTAQHVKSTHGPFYAPPSSMPAHRVWARVRDFKACPTGTAIARAHRGRRARCKIGCVRDLPAQRRRIRETAAGSPTTHFLHYSILEARRGWRLLATLRPRRLTDGDQRY